MVRMKAGVSPARSARSSARPSAASSVASKACSVSAYREPPRVTHRRVVHTRVKKSRRVVRRTRVVR